MKKLFITLFTFVLLLSVASAETCTTLDFNDLKTGEIVNTQYPGVTISAKNANEAIIFDSYNPTGGDWDLATTTQENILIVSENLIDANNDDLIDNPDDNANGGVIIFNFDYPVDITSVTGIDIESVESLRLRSKFSGSTIATTFASGLGDNSLEVIPLVGHTGATIFKAKFSGSGAIDDIVYCPDEEEVPEFGTIAGLAFITFAGLFIYKRRK